MLDNLLYKTWVQHNRYLKLLHNASILFTWSHARTGQTVDCGNKPNKQELVPLRKCGFISHNHPTCLDLPLTVSDQRKL